MNFNLQIKLPNSTPAMIEKTIKERRSKQLAKVKASKPKVKKVPKKKELKAPKTAEAKKATSAAKKVAAPKAAVAKK